MIDVTGKFARLKLAARLVICLLPAMAGCSPQPLETHRQADPGLTDGPMPLREAMQLVNRSMKDWPAADNAAEIRDAFTNTMLRLLAHRDPARRAAAAAALGEFRKPQAVDALLLGAREDNRTVRVAAIKALGWLGDKRCALAVANRLDDPAVDVRIAAADTLGRLKNPVAVKALITACKDPAPRVRAAAAGALGWIRDKRAIKPLVGATNDKTPRVRAAAVGALGLLKDPAALAALIVAGADSSPLVRYQAASALGQLTDPLAKKALRQLVKDSNPAVRRAAKTALERVKRKKTGTGKNKKREPGKTGNRIGGNGVFMSSAAAFPGHRGFWPRYCFWWHRPAPRGFATCASAAWEGRRARFEGCRGNCESIFT